MHVCMYVNNEAEVVVCMYVCMYAEVVRLKNNEKTVLKT